MVVDQVAEQDEPSALTPPTSLVFSPSSLSNLKNPIYRSVHYLCASSFTSRYVCLYHFQYCKIEEAEDLLHFAPKDQCRWKDWSRGLR